MEKQIKRAGWLSKRKRTIAENPRNCYNCNNCVYVGEGGYMCSMSNDIVIDDWIPTEDFRQCKGKDFEEI